ncbi:hypothetical protein G5714_016173 [Onychostoma macrolepis]|uniref:Uncharacterized protein n=1 Tax=Onychostoma macrolepis TaxID=369639 RepID=A0A7J6C7Q9_9TELE|nr:hypothetical protein G5714_016173 [Onychostoma macrolepis]
MQTALLFALLSCFSLIEGKSLGGETCDGTRREDSSYAFELPDAVIKNVQDSNCDAEWSTDQFTAILDGNSAHFSHPFKNVTHQGISVSYCPASVRFHVSCPKYTRELMCYCTNSTNNPVSTSLPSGDAIKTDSSVRQHYCAIAVAATFVISLFILAFLVCRTNSTAKYAPDEQNQPGSAEIA